MSSHCLELKNLTAATTVVFYTIVMRGFVVSSVFQLVVMIPWFIRIRNDFIYKVDNKKQIHPVS